MKIIYLHGYGSSGTGEKQNMLIKRFGAEHVVSPDLPIEPSKVVELVNGIVRQTKDFPVIFVGTSLGGFWANYFGQIWDAPVVIVNPSINPSKSLQKLGLAKEIAMQYKPYENKMEKYQHNHALTNLFLAKDDDVLPYENALQAYPQTAFTQISDTGGHRYIEQWDSVMNQIESIVK